MRRLLLALTLVAALPGCGRSGIVDRRTDDRTVDIAAQADRKAREDAAQALDQRSRELRGKDPAQSKDLEEQARAMRNRNRAAARTS